jgi:hypothetical protein
MNARSHLSELSGPNEPRRVARSSRPLKIAGAVLVILLLLLLTTHSPQIDLKAAQPPVQNHGRTDATFVGDYFPAQFGSPRTSGVPEEHIQAF